MSVADVMSESAPSQGQCKRHRRHHPRRCLHPQRCVGTTAILGPPLSRDPYCLGTTAVQRTLLSREPCCLGTTAVLGPPLSSDPQCPRPTALGRSSAALCPPKCVRRSGPHHHRIGRQTLTGNILPPAASSARLSARADDCPLLTSESHLMIRSAARPLAHSKSALPVIGFNPAGFPCPP